jgi:hypothetical protein
MIRVLFGRRLKSGADVSRKKVMSLCLTRSRPISALSDLNHGLKLLGMRGNLYHTGRELEGAESLALICAKLFAGPTELDVSGRRNWGLLSWFRLRWLLNGVSPGLTWVALRCSKIVVPAGLSTATVETRMRSVDEITAVRDTVEIMEQKGPNLQ